MRMLLKFTSTSLLVEERKRRLREERRIPDVVVGEPGEDRQRMAALRPALAHPAAVALAAIEQAEDLDVVARWRHVGISARDEGRHLEIPGLLAEVEVLCHRGADLVEQSA